MKNNSYKKWIGLLIVFIAVIYSILVFAVKKDLSSSSIIGYGFTMLAFIVTLIQFCFAGYSGEKEYPMFTPFRAKITLVYFFVQLIFGGIIGVFFHEFPETLFLILEIVILIVYLIPAFLFNSAANYVQKQDEYDTANVSNIRLMTADVQAVERLVDDPELLSKLKKLEEALRYSDPVSNPSITGIDERIKNNISILRDDAEDGDMGSVETRVDKVINMVKERNDKIRALKQ